MKSFSIVALLAALPLVLSAATNRLTRREDAAEVCRATGEEWEKTATFGQIRVNGQWKPLKTPVHAACCYALAFLFYISPIVPCSGNPFADVKYMFFSKQVCPRPRRAQEIWRGLQGMCGE